ncbi:hypothetical protein QBC37DRAFT_394973 [Rhypophila decipiens]|uniref:Uncharacterized protein n=1 Tax=Rhypophila decipiens TaxID=261697 RepID=A0AAN6YJI3_9PEZI|nr:hypothetical protein QBC37DRAFT_394973 [Rhypophila decipiens]
MYCDGLNAQVPDCLPGVQVDNVPVEHLRRRNNVIFCFTVNECPVTLLMMSVDDLFIWLCSAGVSQPRAENVEEIERASESVKILLPAADDHPARRSAMTPRGVNISNILPYRGAAAVYDCRYSDGCPHLHALQTDSDKWPRHPLGLASGSGPVSIPTLGPLTGIVTYGGCRIRAASARCWFVMGPPVDIMAISPASVGPLCCEGALPGTRTIKWHYSTSETGL